MSLSRSSPIRILFFSALSALSAGDFAADPPTQPDAVLMLNVVLPGAPATDQEPGVVNPDERLRAPAADSGALLCPAGLEYSAAVRIAWSRP